MKVCNKCKIEKEFSEFYKKINRGEGLAGYSHNCKSCIKKTSRENDKLNMTKIEYNKYYREKNKEKMNEYTRRWRIENEDRMREQRKLKYQNNKDIIKKKSANC